MKISQMKISSKHEIRTGPYARCAYGAAWRLRLCTLRDMLFAFLFLGVIFAGAVAANVDPGIEEISKEIRENPDRVDLVLTRGKMFRKNGKLNKALADVRKADRMDPGNSEIEIELALALSASGQSKEAEKLLNSLVEDESRNIRLVARMERAAVLVRLGKVRLALEDLDKVVAQQPALNAYLLRGSIQEKIGLYAEAAEGYREALTRSSKGNGFVLSKKLVDVEIARGNLVGALEIVDKQRDHAQVKTQWFLRRAEILEAMGRSEKAQHALDNALNEANRVLKKRATAFNQLDLAKVLIATNKLQEANCELQSITEVAPHLKDAKDLLKSVRRGVKQQCTDLTIRRLR